MKVTLEIEVSEEALAFGKKLVNADFNPDKNETVDVMKNVAAVFAAVCEDNRKIENSFAQRRISIAHTHIETACMFAVKSNFSS